jgi:hypothetical protein
VRLVSVSRLCLGLALVAFATMGCGDSVLLDLPQQQTAAHPCEVGAELELTPLDDFESGGEADFSYFANPDDPSGHTDTTPPGADPNSAGLLEVNRCPGTPAASVYALHLSGAGYVTYGPNLGWTIGHEQADARDYSSYSGVAFWARTESTEPQTIQLVLNDAYTFPVDTAADRRCVLASADTPPPAPGTGCWNGGLTVRTLSNEWRLYTVDFSEFRQDDWGQRSPGGRPDLTQLLSIELHFAVESAFDLWIDDIALFRR